MTVILGAEKLLLSTGTEVIHAIMRDGIVLTVAGPIARVKFPESTYWVWVSDLELR